MKQLEQHSVSSLANRLGLSRAATLGAIAGGRLASKKTRVGLRDIYTIETDHIIEFKNQIVQTLEARIAKVVKDPVRAQEAVSRALATIRTEAAADQSTWSPARLAESLGCSLELASWLLNRHATRTSEGFIVTPEKLRQIRAERDSLNDTQPRRTNP